MLTAERVTVATGMGLTTIAAVGLELTDSLVAVIVADPTPAAVAVAVAPVGVTVSTTVLLETQLTVRPVNTLLFASFVVAVSCWVAPTIIGVVGAETVTEATGAGVTVSGAEPFWPSLVATMLADPAATGVTRPVEDTVATAELLELQSTTRPVSARPLESSNVAVAWVV